MTTVTQIGPVDGVAILDFTTTEAGRFCGTLMADMGAQVVRFGAPSEVDDSARIFLDRVLLRNRHWIAADAFADQFKTKLAASQVVLVDEGSAIAEADCRKHNPTIVYCHISPFGMDGPWADRTGGDLVVQALSSFMELTGEPGRPPIRMGAPVLPLMAGAIAAVQVIGCLLRGGPPGAATVDASVLDTALNTLSYMAPMYLTLGQVPGRVGSGHTTIYPYNAFEVADGHIVAAPFTGHFWRNFCKALGTPEWGVDPRFKDFQNRLDNRSILEPLLNARMREKTRDEWLSILEDADVPCGPVNSVAEAIDLDVSVARGLVVEIEQTRGAPIRALGLPLKFTNSDGSHFQPLYRSDLSERKERGRMWHGVASSSADTDITKPLSGIRVLDLTRMAAGPYCTQMLVDLGAEVIKVEEPKIGDPTRRNVPYIGEVSSYFYAFNRGKKSISLDMKTEEGHRIVRSLLGEVDVVIENFRPGVMDRLGLGHEALRTRHPRLIYASISGFGQTGPSREKISFDLVNQAIAGMLAITSEPGRPPARLGMAVGDLGGGLFACLGIMAALKQRERTGIGAHIDISLHDVLVTLLGDLAQDYLSTGITPGPMGSEHAHHVPERVFATGDGWVALEAWTDAGWKLLVEQPGFGDLADPLYGTLPGRLAHRDDIHSKIEAKLAEGTSGEWLARLQKSGIGIASVVNISRALDSDHAAARELVVSNDLPGGIRGRTIGSAFRINGHHVSTLAPPPRLGEHGTELIDAGLRCSQ